MYTVNKKIFFIFVILFSCLRIFAIDLTSLVGSWKPITSSINIDSFTENESIFEKAHGYKIEPYSYVDILIVPENNLVSNKKYLLFAYNANFYIENATWIETEERLILNCRYFHNEYDSVTNSYHYEEADTINQYEIYYIDNEEIAIKDFDGFQGITKYYRISGPARIPVQNAVLNDSNVHLRVKPNLNCDTWAKLSKGTKVLIKDKSKEKFEIDGESWYWYYVDAENYPDGWVYGKYLDIKE